MTRNALDQYLLSEIVLRERDADIRGATDAAAAHVIAPGDILLRYYLVFTDAALVAAAGLGDLDDATLFYNRYYWFRRFSSAHQAAHGYDAGLEQQGSQLLETAPSSVDWSVVEAFDVSVVE